MLMQLSLSNSLATSIHFRMLIVESIVELQQAIAAARAEGKTIGFVPTMGNLHAGHIKLVSTAHKHADIVVVSLFVNPTQFGANEDLGNYPRTLQNDIEKLEAADTDILFTPTVDTIYPLGGENTAHIHVPELTNLHCGASRPGHFDGVTTVVSKLFNMTRADVAIFGEKDFQQLAVIRRMVVDLNIPIKIIGEPIVREQNGLAMSSRNGYLNETERQISPRLNNILLTVKQKILAGDQNYLQLEKHAKQALLDSNFKPDYFNICNSSSLQAATNNDKDIVILAAAFLGSTRLIDNVTLNLN